MKNNAIRMVVKYILHFSFFIFHSSFFSPSYSSWSSPSSKASLSIFLSKVKT